MEADLDGANHISLRAVHDRRQHRGMMARKSNRSRSEERRGDEGRSKAPLGSLRPLIPFATAYRGRILAAFLARAEVRRRRQQDALKARLKVEALGDDGRADDRRDM